MYRFLQAFTLLILILTLSEALKAQELQARFKIPLKENDRVLGTLEGNFVVYGKPYIAMYNNQGQKLWSRKLKNNVKPYLSDNGDFLALVTYADRSPTDLRAMKLEMFQPNGNRRYSISKPAATNYHISNRGMVIGVEGVPGIPPIRLHLYDASGNRITLLNFENYRGLSFSPAGDRFLVDRGPDGLGIFSSSGQPQYTLHPGTYFTFDRTGEYVGIFTEGYLGLYKGEEKVSQINFIETEIVDMAINIEAGVLVLLGQKNLGVFEPLTGKPIKELRLNEREKSFASLDLSNDGNTIVCGVDVNNGSEVPKNQRHSEGYAYIYQNKGNSLILHREKYDSWRIGLPKAVLSPGDNSLMFLTAETIKKLTLPEP